MIEEADLKRMYKIRPPPARYGYSCPSVVKFWKKYIWLYSSEYNCGCEKNKLSQKYLFIIVWHSCASLCISPFFYWVSIQSAKQAKALFYLHKQSPPCFLGQRQLNLSCVVIAWFSLSSWLLACWETMSPGEKQQIVGMQLNETNYYMLTAFTMARLKALSSFNWPPRDSLSKKLDPFDCLYFWVFFFACREWESVREGPWLFDDFSYF